MKFDRPIFINPDGSNKKQVEHTFEQSIKLLLDFLTNANEHDLLPVDADWPGISFQLPPNPSNEENILKELNRVMKLSMNPASTAYIGHMDSIPTLHSIIASLYTAALNNNSFSLEMSPYFTRMEYAIVKQFATLFGLPESSAGVIVSGGTLSNIQAIITARNYHLRSNHGDISTSKKPLVFFASEDSHVSIKKAAMISGLGIDALIYVKCDANGKMNIEDLELKINTAIQNGQEPFAVVATLGTTITGNIDPVKKIATICKGHKLWLHADAIYGGAIILSNKEKYRLEGIEHANSIAFNPQKWMHIAKTCSLLLYREGDVLIKYFGMKAYYTKAQTEFINLSELNIQGTKPADVLKLWLSILSVGLKGYEKMIDDSYDYTRAFVQALSHFPNIEFASKPEMNIPTFRLLGTNDSNSNELNTSFNDYALKEHNLFFSLPTYKNKLWQRTILLNPFLDQSIIDKVCTAIKQFNS